ncbi:4-hydroxy-tetrahydrodipicolinate reductase [Methylobacterium organophilum]|nr:4-hydroxy-tetrahydrodipicolinate reductase [Methylobacterium organophilum]
MRLVVVGADGRMGRMLIRAVAQAEGCTLSAAIERDGSPALGQDAGVLAGLPPLDVPVTDDALTAFAAADGVLDFTAPAATVAFAELAAQGLGHPADQGGHQVDAERHVAGLHDAGVVGGRLQLGEVLLRQPGRADDVHDARLGDEFDIEIAEMHHRMKVDAPSGTALMLGEAAAEGRGVDLKAVRVSTRDGHTGARRPGDIGFATLRGGSVVGDHSVIFAGTGESLTISHHAADRGLFATGAVKAALWAHPKPPGLYTMTDVLGL